MRGRRCLNLVTSMKKPPTSRRVLWTTELQLRRLRFIAGYFLTLWTIAYLSIASITLNLIYSAFPRIRIPARLIYFLSLCRYLLPTIVTNSSNTLRWMVSYRFRVYCWRDILLSFGRLIVPVTVVRNIEVPVSYLWKCGSDEVLKAIDG